MKNHPVTESQVATTKYSFFHFGLIVTGEGEREHLDRLFKSLEATGMCHFKVIRQISQRNPITASTRKLKMVGAGKIIPDTDEMEIGIPVRNFLQATSEPDTFVILIDDLEHSRREMAQEVFDRYRLAIDTMLRTETQRSRASVHFLVNMLEAYYFADASALNKALNLNPPWPDYAGDVEEIRHPKGELRGKLLNNHAYSFDEKSDGGKVLEHLNIEHVLSRPETCRWLRTLFAWCVKALERHPHYGYFQLAEQYQLNGGLLSEITRFQLDNLNGASK
jgi:hypothetical protein